MAYLDQTALNTLQDNSAVQLELRTLEHGLIDFAQNLSAGATWLTPQMRSNLQSITGRSFELPALKEETILVLDEESFDIPINQSESETVTATRVIMYSGFRMYESTFANQFITPEVYRQNKYLEIFKAFAKKKEEYIQTFLESKKTQLYDTTGNVGSNFAFDTGADILNVALDGQKGRMFDTLVTLNRQNNLNGGFSMAGNFGLKHVQDYYLQFGAANQQNLQSQMLPMQLSYSNQITNAINWTGYMGLNGALGMVENYQPDFLKGKSLANASFGITSGEVPFLKERIMMFQNEGLGDASNLGTSTSELKMTTYKEEAFYSSFFIIEKYNSDRATRVSDIIKVGGLST